MVKSLNNTKITVQNNSERYEFDAPNAAIGSLTGGATHFLTAGELHNMKKTTRQPFTEWSVGGTDLPDLPAAKSAQETAMIGAAKAQERATLNAARIIEKAHEQAEALINDAYHVLNSAIQAYLHTSKTAVDVARVRDKAGIYYNEVRGENVASLNTENLYLLDATELLTVG